MTSVPAVDVEDAVLDHVQKLLAAPELIARTWATAKHESEDEIAEREVTPARRLRHGLERAVSDRAGTDRPAPRRACRRAGGRAGGAGQSRGACQPRRGASTAGREESGMTQGVERRLDGETLVVRIPLRFQRRGGRKRIVAPDGSAIVPTTKPQPDGTLVKVLARAHRWQRMLDEARFATVRELAEAERVGHSYVARILRLTLLAPDIVEHILDGRRAPQLADLMQPFPVEWDRQRERFFNAARADAPYRRWQYPGSR